LALLIRDIGRLQIEFLKNPALGKESYHFFILLCQELVVARFLSGVILQINKVFFLTMLVPAKSSHLNVTFYLVKVSLNYLKIERQK
jgi:hypothetical protein